MSSINSTTVTHTTSFDVIDSIEGVHTATREIFENIAWENINEFEGLMFRNTFIASNNFTGGMNAKVNPMQVSMATPAGSFRSLLTPKGSTKEFGPISGLADIKFDQFANDAITLEIDTYITSGNPTLIYAVDGTNGSWLVDDIKSAAQGQAISALVRTVNYKTYKTLKNGALAQIDPSLGAQGRVAKASTDNAQFTNDLIDDIAKLKALPGDRYVSGFKEGDLVIAISPQGHAKLLKEKLVLYDGQFMGNEGKFFNGLPYTHRFAGVAMIETIFMNDEVAQDFEYIGLPVGKYSPFLFHLARFAGWAEKVPFTDGAIGIYGTNLHGMKVEDKLDQYLFARTVEDPTQVFTTNVTGVKAVSNSAGELTLSYASKTGDVLYRVTKENELATGAWTVMASDTETVGSLETDTKYRVEFASAITGETTPEVSTVFTSKSFVIVKTVRTL